MGAHQWQEPIASYLCGGEEQLWVRGVELCPFTFHRCSVVLYLSRASALAEVGGWGIIAGMHLPVPPETHTCGMVFALAHRMAPCMQELALCARMCATMKAHVHMY